MVKSKNLISFDCRSKSCLRQTVETQTDSNITCDYALQMVGKMIVPETLLGNKIPPVLQRRQLEWKRSFPAYEKVNPKTGPIASEDNQWEMKDINKTNLDFEGSATDNEEENAYANMCVVKRTNDTNDKSCRLREQVLSKVPKKKWLNVRRHAAVFDHTFEITQTTNERDCAEYVTMNTSDIHTG